MWVSVKVSSGRIFGSLVLPRLPTLNVFVWKKDPRELIESYRQTKTTTINYGVTCFLLEILIVVSASGQACVQVRTHKSAE